MVFGLNVFDVVGFLKIIGRSRCWVFVVGKWGGFIGWYFWSLAGIVLVWFGFLYFRFEVLFFLRWVVYIVVIMFFGRG